MSPHDRRAQMDILTHGQRVREMDTHTDRDRETQVDRETDGHTDRQRRTERQMGR